MKVTRCEDECLDCEHWMGGWCWKPGTLSKEDMEMKPMTVYLAGPMTGIEDYRSRFTRAETVIRALGHTVLNPAWLPATIPRDDAMTIGRTMLSVSDLVVFLDGWEHSNGCREEFELARRSGIATTTYDEFLPEWVSERR